MNFFEQELRKLLGHGITLSDGRFIGRVCFGKLTDSLRIRMEFVTQGIADHYTAINATIINRNDGPVDSLTLQFSDLFGTKTVNNPNFKNGIVPYIWSNGGRSEWYVYKPTMADYEQISKTLNDYLDMFRCPTLEMEQIDHNKNGQIMQSI